MRKLIVCNLMSLDGYYAGPGDNLDVLPFDGAFYDYCAERLRAAGTMLTGRSTFDLFREYWPSVAEDTTATPTHRDISRLIRAIDKVAISDSMTTEETAPWRDTRIVRRADAHEQMGKLKHQPGKEIVVFGSRTVWHELFAHNLVDELHLIVGNALLGEGTSIVGTDSNAALRLLDTSALPGSDNVLLRYEIHHLNA